MLLGLCQQVFGALLIGCIDRRQLAIGHHRIQLEDRLLERGARGFPVLVRAGGRRLFRQDLVDRTQLRCALCHMALPAPFVRPRIHAGLGPLDGCPRLPEGPGSVAALKGSTLKEFIQDALQQAVASGRGVRRHKVRLPLIRSKHPGALRLTNADIEDHLARH